MPRPRPSARAWAPRARARPAGEAGPRAVGPARSRRGRAGTGRRDRGGRRRWPGRDEVVGVVLHERGPAGQAGRHDLHRPDEQGRLPVALGAEAVAVGHQALDADPRELDEVAEVLEGVRDGSEAAGLEEAPETDLDPGSLAKGWPAIAAGPERWRHPVAGVVL